MYRFFGAAFAVALVSFMASFAYADEPVLYNQPQYCPIPNVIQKSVFFPGNYEFNCDHANFSSKWSKATQQNRDSIALLERCLAGDPACNNFKNFAAWKNLILVERRHNRTLEKILSIHEFFNDTVEYRTDQEMYGENDVWMALADVLKTGNGDCEDIALAKYYTILMALNAGENPDVRVVILLEKKNKLSHSVMVVRTDRQTITLDNNPDAKMTDYFNYQNIVPVYSMTEKSSLCHARPIGHKGNCPVLPEWTYPAAAGFDTINE